MDLFFNTINKSKQNEIEELFSPYACNVKFLNYDITYK